MANQAQKTEHSGSKKGKGAYWGQKMMLSEKATKNVEMKEGNSLRKVMDKGREKSAELTSWGNSLLNKLPSTTRNRRKRDASKRRRNAGAKEIRQGLNEN